MKKILPVFTLLLVGVLITNAQVARKIMIEQFTQASCAPCAAQNPAFNTMLKANYTKHVSLKYQTSWPGVDPMNAQNPTEVANRVTYYNVTGVPNVECNGETVLGGSFDGSPDGVTQAFIDEKALLTSPLTVNVSHSISSLLDSIAIRVVVKNVTNTTFSTDKLVIHTAVIEKTLNFPTAPGSNGEKDFYNVMRKMLPNADGSAVNGNSIAAGDSVVLNFNVWLPYYIYKYNQIGVVAFVQDKTSKEVFQAEISEPQILPAGSFGDASAISRSVVPNTTSGYCNYTTTPKLTLKNTGKSVITSATVRMTLNNVNTDTTVVANTNPLDSIVITFPTIQANIGKNTLGFTLLSINGTRDTVGYNNNVANLTFTTMNDKVFGTNLTEGFETTANGTDPLHALQVEAATFMVNVVDKSYFGAAANAPSMGAFQKSEKSLMFNFWAGGWTGLKASVIYEKLDFTNAKNLNLTFDHAYTQFEGTENDKLEIRASFDCGKTWTTLWTKAGAALKTAPEVANNNLPFLPEADQWVSDTIKLTALEGKSEVNIQFQGTSAFGDNLYVDNINLNELSVGNKELNFLEGNVFAYPNPASELVNIDLNITEATNLSVKVLDATGKTIDVIAQNKEFGVGLYKLNWIPTDAGFYMIRINSDKGEVTRKITVVK